MEPVASMAEKFKCFAKSCQDFVDSLLHRCNNDTRSNPIEVLKRLQQETFSDIMKLRDRQDKVEQMLSSYKSSNGSPFKEASTHVRGEIDSMGAILMIGDVDQQHNDTLERAGIKTGISPRFIFETSPLQKDSLVAEFVASQKDTGHSGNVSGTVLSLTKVMYMANVCNWFSVIAIPVGAQFKDIDIATNPSIQRKALSDLASVGPPLLNQPNDIALGMSVRQSNVIASIAQSVTRLGMQSYHGVEHCLSTFGQIVCQIPGGTKLSLLAVQQVPKSSSRHINLGAIVIPLSFLKYQKASQPLVETAASSEITHNYQTTSTGSIALKLETELDETTRIGGWIEMKNSNPKHLQWSINAFDESEDEFGWGISVSGMVEGSCTYDHLQGESYLKLNLGKKFNLKPGIVYAVDGNARLFALMLRSNWTF